MKTKPTREVPMLFSGEMVRRLLDGSKTQTRRPLKPKPVQGETHLSGDGLAVEVRDDNGDTIDFHESRIKPGDIIWVRETWAEVFKDCSQSTKHLRRWNNRDHVESVLYAAEFAGVEKDYIDWKWRPSIHMPRWAARLFLRVESVRVERLQSISNADAIAEGVSGETKMREQRMTVAQHLFADLWDSTYGPDAWSANPFCWVYSFKRI